MRWVFNGAHFLCQGHFSAQVDLILDGVENDDWEDIAVNVEVVLIWN